MNMELTPTQQRAIEEGKKIRTSFRLTLDAVRLLDEAAKRHGIPKTSVLEQAIRAYAKKSK